MDMLMSVSEVRRAASARRGALSVEAFPFISAITASRIHTENGIPILLSDTIARISGRPIAFLNDRRYQSNLKTEFQVTINLRADNRTDPDLPHRRLRTRRAWCALQCAQWLLHSSSHRRTIRTTVAFPVAS